MLSIDGSMGEGGGQILRSSLALSLVTQMPFRIDGIRAGRSRPGLLRQHLAGVRAATAIGGAEVRGAELGSTSLEFRPGAIVAGDHAFAIGSAGSATLVFQTVLPAMLAAPGPSTLTVEGGTHNSAAPPFDFLARAFTPLLARMGAEVVVTLERPGFYPAGGGSIRVEVAPWSAASQKRLELLERGAIVAKRAEALLAELPSSIAVREVDALAARLGWDRRDCRPRMVQNSRGPGNVLLAEIESAHVTEVFAGFGEKGVRADAVANTVATEVERYLAADVPVFEHLADQLVLPMALGAGGVFRTVTPSPHLATQIEVVRAFLGVRIAVHADGDDRVRIEVEGTGASRGR